MPSLWNTISMPISGDRLAIHGGSPAATMTLGGTIHRAEVIETFGDGSIVPTGKAQFGEPLISDGVTVWLEGFFPTSSDGLPTVEDRATILSNWDTLHAKLIGADFQFFLHYEPGDDALFRKYQSLNTVLIRSYWADPVGFLYQLAAVTTNHTLSATSDIEGP
jgi:hypothetical protein